MAASEAGGYQSRAPRLHGICPFIEHWLASAERGSRGRLRFGARGLHADVLPVRLQQGHDAGLHRLELVHVADQFHA